MPRKYIILLLITLPSVLYANALSNSFHYDDLHTIVNNPHIRSDTFIGGVSKIPDFFTSSQYYSGETHHVGHYRPLLYTTYVVNYAATGLSPIGFRLINLGLHLGCVIMVYLLALRLLGNAIPAFLAAVTFAIHPLFSEGVNYISARSSLLATFFYLLAFYYFIQFRDTRGMIGRAWVRLILFILFTFLAFLSKEIAITLPLILMLYDLLFTRVNGVKLYLKTTLPYLPVILMGILLLDAVNFTQYFKNIYLSNEFINNYLFSILAQIKGLVLMIGLFFLPIGLSIDHSILRPGLVLEPGVIGAMTVLLGILGCVFFLYRSHKGVAFFLLWLIVTALPTLLVPLNVPFLENRGYLSGVGLAIVMGWAMGFVRDNVLGTPRHTLMLVFYASIFILYAGITIHRNTVWENDLTLWLDAVTQAPDSDRAWTNLGLAYLSDKDHERAVQAFQQALSLNPDNALALVGVGSSYHLQGKLDAAIQSYQDSIRLYPDYFLPHFNLGVAYQQLGYFEKALNAYQEALKINVHHPETHLNLGSVYLALGKHRLAIEEYHTALEINPDLADAHYNMAVTYEALGQNELAAHHYKEAEQLENKLGNK